MKKKVVSIHFTNKCNMSCPFCYKEKGNDVMDRELFLGLPKYLKEITDQVALGGGEPLTEKELLRDFAAECKKVGLICNVTTNGRLIKDMTDDEVKDIFKDIRMVSLSFDDFKLKSMGDLNLYQDSIKRLKTQNIEVGANLLVNSGMFNKNMGLVKTVGCLYKMGVDRVFVLYPKNMSLGVDITKFKEWYVLLTIQNKYFYVDDLTQKILTEGYGPWLIPCHYGNDILNINLDGSVSGCSFCKETIGKIEKPEDVLLFKDFKGKRLSCPFLKFKKEVKA